MRGRRHTLPIILPLAAVSLLLMTGCGSRPSAVPPEATRQGSLLQAASTRVSPPPSTPSPVPSPTLLPSPAYSPTPDHKKLAPTLTPTASPSPTPPRPTATGTPVAPSPSPPPPTPILTPTPTPQPFTPDPPAGHSFASLDEFWTGEAEWLLEVHDTGLPVGESDTVHRGGGEFWSYLHANYESAGVLDSCGDPVPFPGCVTLWKSYDGGRRFALEVPHCLFACRSCPCLPGWDHVGQQQYPRVASAPGQAYIAYEWGAGTYIRTSTDGLQWSAEVHLPGTGQWRSEKRACTDAASVGDHPNIYAETEFGDCLVGAPPGIVVDGDLLYVFVGMGRNPGHMGCYAGPRVEGVRGLSRCASNPLITGSTEYGPLEARGAEANPYFDFRTISSADVARVGDRYYMAYEGVRGPSNPSVVDDQFALGFARSVGPAIDGPWEKYPGNPLLGDVANNWGIGHADLVIIGPTAYLYTATSRATRGRYVLVQR